VASAADGKGSHQEPATAVAVTLFSAAQGMVSLSRYNMSAARPEVKGQALLVTLRHKSALPSRMVQLLRPAEDDCSRLLALTADATVVLWELGGAINGTGVQPVATAGSGDLTNPVAICFNAASGMVLTAGQAANYPTVCGYDLRLSGKKARVLTVPFRCSSPGVLHRSQRICPWQRS